MTFTDLHKILDDENRKLSLKELKQVIYDEMIECTRQSTCVEYNGVSINKVATSDKINPYWQGKQNAFQIVLDLLEYLDHFILPCKPNDIVYYVTEVDDGNDIYFTIMNGVVDCFNIETGCKEFLARYDGGLTYWHSFLDFGKEVFTDKSAAERKLREIQGK